MQAQGSLKLTVCMLHRLSFSDAQREEELPEYGGENVAARNRKRDGKAAAAGKIIVHATLPPHLGSVQFNTLLLLFVIYRIMFNVGCDVCFVAFFGFYCCM